MEGLLDEFVKTLRSLTTNDKYLINTLSVIAMKAKEDFDISKDIAKASLNAILEANFNMKLPFFYVVDSIIKNVGTPYKEIFGEKLIEAFISTFQSNKDHKIRIKLYNLRLTWKCYFPTNLMNDLDEQVRKFDPAWPLVTKFDPKTKSADSKKADVTDNINSDKSTPDSTTPSVSRDPRIQKIILPEIKKERKRKNFIDDDEENELFKIDRRGDNHIKKVVNKKGRLEESAIKKESGIEGLFGTKDVDLRVTEESSVKDKQWTSEGVFEMLKKKMDVNGNHRAFKVETTLPINNGISRPINTFLPPPQNNSTLEHTPIPAPREPTWEVIVEGFPQLPHIGTDPRLLARCPYPDAFRTINIDGRKYLLYLDRIQPCIFVNNELHAVRFYCHNLVLNIDNSQFILTPTSLTHIKINRRFYIACLGGPGHELIINGWPYNVRIDGSVHRITVGGITVNVQFMVDRPVQVNVQNAIPPYVCEWAVKDLFGSPQYLNMPPLNPLRNPKFHDPKVNDFRNELNIIFPKPFQENPIPIPAPPVNIDVHDLFQKLVSTGIIQPKTAVDLKLEITKYSWDVFKMRNEKEINELSNGHQCDLCGTRFKNKDSKEFELHLDYHFYKNTTSLTSTRKNRDYVGGSRQWIIGGSMRNNGPAFNFEELNCEQKFRCPKFEDDKLNKCAVCLEGFKVDWDDEEDSYMLLDGQLHNGKVYHPICLEDADKQIENSEIKVEDDDKSQIELTDQPLEALEKVLQGKSESVMLPDQCQTDSDEKKSSECQDFQYESVNS